VHLGLISGRRQGTQGQESTGVKRTPGGQTGQRVKRYYLNAVLQAWEVVQRQENTLPSENEEVYLRT
jgi:hypothetical protein